MNSKPSFKTDILPLFTERDIEGNPAGCSGSVDANTVLACKRF